MASESLLPASRTPARSSVVSGINSSRRPESLRGSSTAISSHSTVQAPHQASDRARGRQTARPRVGLGETFSVRNRLGGPVSLSTRGVPSYETRGRKEYSVPRHLSVMLVGRNLPVMSDLTTTIAAAAADGKILESSARTSRPCSTRARRPLTRRSSRSWSTPKIGKSWTTGSSVHSLSARAVSVARPSAPP